MNDRRHHPHWHSASCARKRGAWGKRPRFLFFRFATLFGLMALLIAGSMGVLALLLTLVAGGDGRTAVLVWLGGCGLALGLPLLALALGIRAWRGIAQPLGAVMEAADALAEGDLSARVAVDRPGEFGGLARSFNRMARKLERAEQARRNLTADVAHELRTPLQIIQGNLEGVLDGVYEPTPVHINDTLEETQLLARLVDDLQLLALAEAGELSLHLERVDARELLIDVATSFGGQAQAADVTLHLALPEDGQALTVTADVDRLDQVLGNLVANALRHTPAGGAITLSASAQDGSLNIAVVDTGSGIPEDDLPYVFDRFWRGDKARSGTGSGLGLSIASQLVAAHQGHIEVTSTVGKGTTFTVHLPR